MAKFSLCYMELCYQTIPYCIATTSNRTMRRTYQRVWALVFAIFAWTFWISADVDVRNSSIQINLETSSLLASVFSNPPGATETKDKLMDGSTIDDSLQWPFSSPDQVYIYLIHVGKAGGKSLYKLLNVTNPKERFGSAIDCRINSNNTSACPDTTSQYQLGRRLMGHFHLYKAGYTSEWTEWLDNHTNLLLFTIRDPVERLVSAFNYHRHQSYDSKDPKPTGIAHTLFSRCFATIEDLALISTDTQNRAFCAEKATAVLKGHIAQPVVHFRYNFEFYISNSWKDYPDKHVAVVRTNSMWKDLARLEELLGGDPSGFLSLDDHKNSFPRESASFVINSTVGKTGAFNICCAIAGDIVHYHNLILAAVNLNHLEKLDEVKSIQRHCGLSPIEFFFSNASKWLDWKSTRCKVATAEANDKVN